MSANNRPDVMLTVVQVFSWFWPLASTPSRDSGLEFETNGFEDSNTSWPPPDPDRIPRQPRSDVENAFTFGQHVSSKEEEIAAFTERQLNDLQRREQTIRRRPPFHQRYSAGASPENESEDADEESEPDGFESDGDSDSGEEAWRSPSGDRLRDFGVDEDAEFYDEDNIPLAELLHRRRSERSR